MGGDVNMILSIECMENVYAPISAYDIGYAIGSGIRMFFELVIW